MTDKILLKRSLVSGSVPTTASLEVGELAINVHDATVYLKQSGSGQEAIRPLLALDTDSTGDVLLTGSIVVTEDVTASNFIGDLLGTALTASHVEFNNVDGLTNYTSSVDTKINNLEVESGSIRSALNSYTSSNDLRVNALEVESGSIRTDFSNYTSSTELRLGALEVESGSIRTTLHNYTSSTDNRLSSLETESGSIRTDFNNFTSSVETALTFDNINVTANGNLTVAGDLLVQGTQSIFNTQEFTVENNIIELNTAGNIKGGILVGDITQPSELSGSLLWDGLNDYWIAGISGSEQRIILQNEFTNYTSSTDNRLSSLEVESGSIRTTLNNYTSSNDLRVGALEVESGSIRTDFSNYTSSTDPRLNSLETESGSIRTDFSNYTSSADNRLSSLEVESGSIRANFSNYTSSNDLRVNALEVESGSIRTDFSNYTSSTDLRVDALESESGSIRTDFNSFTGSYNTGSFTGSFSGDGSNLTGIDGFPFTGSAEISGSLIVDGAVTATSFSGDGSGLTGVVVNIEEITTFAQTFVSQTSITVIHNLDTISPLIQVYNDNDEQIIPDKIKILNNNQILVEFPVEVSGKVVVAKGGHIIETSDLTYIAQTFTNISIVPVSHSLNTDAPIVQVYDTNGLQIIPQEIRVIDENILQVEFPSNTSGKIAVSKGGHIIDVTEAANLSYIAQTFTNLSIVSVSHSLDTDAPIVQVYDSTGLQIIPQEIRVIDENNLQVEFPINTSGKVAVSKGGHIIIGSEFSGSFIGEFVSTENLIPDQDNIYTLGTSESRWSDIFTGDLHLSNEGTIGNSVDGTTGNWTIQEGNDSLFIINNKSGKKFRIMLEEVL